MTFQATLVAARFRMLPAAEPVALRCVQAWDRKTLDEPLGAVQRARTLEDALAAVGFVLSRDRRGQVDGVAFVEDSVARKFGELGTLWARLAPFIQAGSFIELDVRSPGEGLERHRWEFDGRACTELSGPAPARLIA